MPDDCAVALAGDWGTGTQPAYRVADDMREQHPHVTIHLGDVYYSGVAEEYRDYFFPAWPLGSLRTFLLNSNHEMYSGGFAYFDEALPALNQEASYFCLENANWRVIGLDTGYYARMFPLLEFLLKGLIRLPKPNVAWLRDVVFSDPRDRRPTILLSHHQWFSSFDTEYGGVGRSVRPFLDRVALWFWAHEHRLAGYARFGLGNGATVRARCIGHGGMPIELGKKQRRDRNLVFVDERKVSSIGSQQLGACGYVLLHFKGEVLTVEYRDQGGKSLLIEEWRNTPTGVRGTVIQASRELTWLQSAERLIE